MRGQNGGGGFGREDYARALENALEILDYGAVLLNERGEILQGNQYWRRLLRDSLFIEKGGVGLNFFNLIKRIIERSADSSTADLEEDQSAGGGELERLLSLNGFSGEEQDSLVFSTRAFQGGSLVFFKKDQIEKRLPAMGQEIFYRDPLTGLYNRRFFQEEIGRLDTVRQLPLSIILADVNGLKLINDLYGHKTGDRLLKKVAEALSKVVRQEDILARWGGDEFVIILPQTDRETAVGIKTRIREECNRSSTERLYLSLGIGVAVKEEGSQDFDQVFQQADSNMYQDKLIERRRNRRQLIKIIDRLYFQNGQQVKKMRESFLQPAGLAYKLGESLGLTSGQLDHIIQLAVLHELGKTSYPKTAVLAEGWRKEEGLKGQEWEKVRKYAEAGYRIALLSEKYSSLADYILLHHTSWQGNEFPVKIREEDVSRAAEILAVVDVFVEMAGESLCSSSGEVEKVLEKIEKFSGSFFQPELVEKLKDVVRETVAG